MADIGARGLHRHAYKVMILLVAGLLGPLPPVAQSQSLTLPDPIEGIWEGSYVCAQGETAASVAMAKVALDGTTQGTFTFGSLPGRTNARAGSYRVGGTYDGARRTLTVRPAGWIDQPENYIQVGFTAALDASGLTLSGSVDFVTCTTIVLHRRAVS